MRKIINKYIIREITYPFFMIIFILTFVLLMGKILKLMDMMVNKGVGLLDVAKLVLYLMPQFLMFTIPIAFLIALLIGVGRLSGDNEITVLKASGVSLYQQYKPVFILSLCAFLLTFITGSVLVPWGNIATKNLLFDIAKQKASIGISEKIFNDDFNGILLYADKIPVNGSYLEGIIISDNRMGKTPSTIIAERAYLVSDPQSMTVTIRLQNGSTHSVDSKLDSYRKMDFSSYDINLGIEATADNAKTRGKKSSEEMTLPEMINNIKSPRQKEADLRDISLELNKRFSLPLACIVFGILGLPLGIRAERSVKSRGFTLGLIIVIGYHMFQLMGKALVTTGRLHPALGAWAPNLFFGLLGLYIFVTVAADKDPLGTLKSLVFKGRMAGK